MVKQIVGEGARVLHTLCFPSQFGCTDDGAPRYAYDPAKAKQLLAEAGFPNGFDIDLYAYRERNQTEAMIGYLRAVGIRANLRFMQYAAMREADARRQGGVLAPDLGFVLGQRRVGVDAGLLQVRPGRRHRAIRKCATSCNAGRHSRSIRRCARTPTSKALALIAERAYSLPLYSLTTYYVAYKDLAFTAYPDEMPRFWEMTCK